MKKIGFLVGLVLKNLLAKDVDWIPWVGKIPCKRKCSPLRYSCLGNPVDRGAWRAAVRRAAECQRWLRAHEEENPAERGFPGGSGVGDVGSAPTRADSTSRGAPKPWGCWAEPRSRNHGGREHSGACGPQGERPSEMKSPGITAGEQPPLAAAREKPTQHCQK